MNSPDAGDEPNLPLLPVAAVARRMGVSPSTLRTWDRRYGLGPSGHVRGKHRRYTSADMARLEAMQAHLLRGATTAEAARYVLSHPVAEPPGVAGTVHTAAARLRRGDPPSTRSGASAPARRLGQAVLVLNDHAAREILTAQLTAHGTIHTWEEVVRPVLTALGERWTQDGSGMDGEHLLSQVLQATLTEVLDTGPPPMNPRPVLLACMPGELHHLPLLALSAALAERGVDTRNFGPALPAGALTAAIRRSAPAAVFLWAHTPDYADLHLLTTLPRTRPRTRLLLGGPGWTARNLPTTTRHLTSLSEACDHITHILSS